MSEATASDERPLRQPVECRITIDGEEITEFYRWLREVRVERARGAAGTAALIFDTVRGEQGEWLVQDSELFRPWRAVAVAAVFGDRIEPVMRGFIRDVEVDNPDDMGAAQVTVNVQDDSLMLDRTHRRRSWSTRDAPRTDGEIARAIAGDYGLDAETEEGLTNAALGQDETDIAFLRRRAEANGFELYVDDGVLHFHPPRLQGGDQPAILVYAGSATNCVSVAFTFDGHLPDAVRVVRADAQSPAAHAVIHYPDLPLLGRESAASGGSGQSDFTWDLARPSGATDEEVAAKAVAAANENAWKVSGDGTLDGALYGSVLAPYATVIIDGVGDTYGGRYYVADVTHSFALEGYQQAFRLIRNAIGQDVWP